MLINNKFTMTSYYCIRLIKKLSIGYVSNAGRNFSGIICVHHRGGGHKRNFKLLDFYRRINHAGLVLRCYKTAFRTALIGLVVYTNGLCNHIILNEYMFKNTIVYAGSVPHQDYALITDGTTLPLLYMSLFNVVCNIEDKPFGGIKLARSAGSSAVISSKGLKSTAIKLTNGYLFTLSNYCMCSFGQVSNAKHRFSRFLRAGQRRNLGIRPTVRGVAMNPHDHPHGGGEGKKSPPSSARSPWGKLTKGTPTVRCKTNIKVLDT